MQENYLPPPLCDSPSKAPSFLRATIPQRLQSKVALVISAENAALFPAHVSAKNLRIVTEWNKHWHNYNLGLHSHEDDVANI